MLNEPIKFPMKLVDMVTEKLTLSAQVAQYSWIYFNQLQTSIEVRLTYNDYIDVIRTITILQRVKLSTNSNTSFTRHIGKYFIKSKWNMATLYGARRRSKYRFLSVSAMLVSDAVATMWQMYKSTLWILSVYAWSTINPWGQIIVMGHFM